MGKFSNQVAAFNREFEKRYRAVARTAVEDTVERAQRVQIRTSTDLSGITDVPVDGRMPVVTGFLRASIQGGLNGMPSGPTSNEKNKEHSIGSQVAGEAVGVTITKWNPVAGETISIGWTAIYSRHMEAKYGFLQGAVEVWDQTVKKAAIKAQAIG